MSKSSRIKSKPFEVGLTGGIGSGKSTVARMFDILGVPVFNADMAGREILDSDAEVRTSVSKLFGTQVYNDGKADRKAIAEKVFGDDELRKKLNAIIHPAVGRAYAQWRDERQVLPVVMKESALVFETGIHQNLDATILVTAPVEVRMERTTARDGVKREDVESRMAAQLTDSEKLPMADFVIENHGNHAVIPQCIEVLDKIRELIKSQ